MSAVHVHRQRIIVKNNVHCNHYIKYYLVSKFKKKNGVRQIMRNYSCIRRNKTI